MSIKVLIESKELRDALKEEAKAALLSLGRSEAQTILQEELPVLPIDHPDLQEWDQCWDRLKELADKHGWLYCGSYVRQVVDEDGVPHTQQGFSASVDGVKSAKNFAQFGMQGILAGAVHAKAVANLHDFHADVVPALFGKKG